MTNEEAIKDLQMHNCESCSGLFCKNGCSVDMAISALISQRWIPVTERLPEECTKNLVIMRNPITGKEYIEVLTFLDETLWDFSVIYWMPLPPMPKEERK